MRYEINIVLAILAVMIVPVVSQADGMGLSYTYGSGDSVIRIDGQPNIASTMKRTGYGIMYDTNVGRDDIFNYRLNIEKAVFDTDDDSYEALVMVNDFAFALVRNEHVRLWFGPEVTIALINDKGSTTAADLFGFGMGLAAGANLHMGKNFSLALKAAYVSQTLSGRMTVSGTRHDVTTYDDYSYVGISLMYRFDERF